MRATQVNIQASSACLGDLALVEDDVTNRVDASRQEPGGHLAGAPFQGLRVLPRGDRVQVHDAVDAFMGFLQRDESHDRAQIITEMEIARRLNPGKNPHRSCH